MDRLEDTGGRARPGAGNTPSIPRIPPTRTKRRQGGTSRQRRDAIQAEILEDKLRRDRAEFVIAEQMCQVLMTLLAHLGKSLERLLDQLAKKLDLPDSSADAMRVAIDYPRRNMAEELRTLLG